jgi:hypothetical protein
VKLVTQIIARKLLGRYASVKHRNVQTAHISLQIYSFVKEHEGKNKLTALKLKAQPPPYLRVFYANPSRSTAVPLPFVSDRLRFGEAAFRSARREPQEEKTLNLSFFSYSQL